MYSLTEAKENTAPTPPLPTARDRSFATLFVAALGALLAAGFLPTSKRAFTAVSSAISLPPGLAPWGEMAAFPLLAGFFYLSLPPAARRMSPARPQFSWWQTLPVPLLIACAYGALRGSSPLPAALSRNPEGLAWLVLFVPLGEEWLFRGWVYALVQRRWSGAFASFTNPMPLAVWLSSLAFALWHLQNLHAEPVGVVAFQLVYTFLTGLWLGYLRFATGRLLPACLAHAGINLASNLL